MNNIFSKYINLKLNSLTGTLVYLAMTSLIVSWCIEFFATEFFRLS